MHTLMGSGSGFKPPTTKETGFGDPSYPFQGPLGSLDPLAAEHHAKLAGDTQRVLDLIENVAGGTGTVVLRNTAELAPRPPSNN